MLLAVVAAAQAAVSAPPPITVAPPLGAPPGPSVAAGRALVPWEGLSPDGHRRILAMDAKAHDLIVSRLVSDKRRSWPGDGTAVAAWKEALARFPVDLPALRTAGAAIDSEFDTGGIFAGWAATFGSMGIGDQKTLAPYLAVSQGRIWIDVPQAPPPKASSQPIPLEARQNKAMHDLQQAIYAIGPDAELLAATEETHRLEAALPAIAHRRPFDAAALRKAYGDLARAIGRANARRSEIVIEQLAKMPPDQRALAIERIPYLATPRIATPPAPERK